MTDPRTPRRPAAPCRALVGAVLAAAVLLTAVPGSGAATGPALPAAAAARAGIADPCGPGGNEITCENDQDGTPSTTWDDMWGAGSGEIQGFATEISVDAGERVDFKIDADTADYTVTIYRIGYYDGAGARRITSVPVPEEPQDQPECFRDVATELYDCGVWDVSASWQVPPTAVSGVYVARLEIPTTGDASQITFVVRDDDSDADIIFQTSDSTWQAYNAYGGSSFYVGGANGRAHKVSYNRPMLTRNGVGGRDFFFANEYPLVRFLEKNGYDVSYQAGVDTDRRGHLLRNHDVFLSVGHDEYWSGAQRANVEAARDAGVNLQFLSGNDVYWRTRYEPSADDAHTPYRTLVSYKETWDYGKVDPSPQWTGTWRDPRYAGTAQGAGRPENALTGTQYQVNHDDLPVRVDAEEGRLRLWRDTGLEDLAPGQTATLAPHTIGYESNEDVDNGHRPPGLVRLSTTTGPTPEYLTDYGNTTRPGTTTHHLTMYRAASGALVFSAGSVQWTWGLDGQHDSPYDPEPPDRRMQQAQVNLLADMRAQPRSLAPDLVPASASTDTTGPTATIDPPPASLANGQRVTVSGTAADAGGGRVAGVEVSTDEGDTWHPATGRETWSHSYVQHGIGSERIRVRAVDDSGNIGSVAARPTAVSCPCSVYGARRPAIEAADDDSAAELGLRFSVREDGFLTGIRFHKGAGNAGTHTGTLWSTDGDRLARATFTDESATGWQRADFTSAVPVRAGETYVASYTAPAGRYSVEVDAFSSGALRRAPFLVAGGYGAAPAGVFGTAGQFPTRSHRNTGYFVDPVFSRVDTSPLTLVDRFPLPGATSVPRTTPIRATFSKAVAPASATLSLVDATGAAVAGSRSYDAATRTVTLVPAAPLAGGVAYTATAAATDAAGQPVSGPVSGPASWTFTAALPQGPPGACPCSLFSDESAPAITEAADTLPVTLGVGFRSDVAGTVTAIRFHKGPGNTGPHRGTLWSADGPQVRELAAGTFTAESTAGWQTLVLDEPQPILPGVEYVASYRTTVGRYSLSPGAFAAADLSRAPLRVGPTAGRFSYGTGFPDSRSSSSYGVDVVFEKAAPAIAVTGQAPPPGALEVPRSAPIRVWFSAPLQPGASLTASVGGHPVPASLASGADGTRLTLTPDAPLPADSVVTVRLAGVRSTDGAVLPDRTWTFRTADPSADAVQTIFGDAVPDVASDDSSAPVELGTVFEPTRDGEVRALRFLKAPGNLGTHVGTLWGSDEEVLAQATFTDETPDGWQRVRLSTPVRVRAGERYVVSYLAPQGHYSYSPGFFAQPVTSGRLLAPAQENGRFRYGTGGGFPRFSHAATAYFADVEYLPDLPAVAVTGQVPAPGATGVSAGVRPALTLSVPIRPGASVRVLAGGAPVPGAAALSTDGRRLTFTPTASLPADEQVVVEVSGVVSTDGAALADLTWSFRTDPAPVAFGSLFASMTPESAAVADPAPVEVGVSFVPAADGAVTAVRFFKGAANTGVHVGSLWSADGRRLAEVTFAEESASGWQTADLATPYPVTAGETYVVSYYAPRGQHAATPGFFGQPWTAGAMTVPAAGNGRFRYGAGGGFPDGSWDATNYFVDVVLRVP
ncbi:DUF4082 domain-containing protein [Nocardioides pantholopis]|uniref:DUF4082 domain-containing protein n=1 Tax=Nocardioides pantholopis TaxID=2483798 RepID=UPI000F092634|nr:DUF4082 domain-containing protein [Nocardioides pantholopis]